MILCDLPYGCTNFNPRTPCGVRQNLAFPRLRRWLFQSTHPLRGATPPHGIDTEMVVNFNPRTPCGVRPYHKCSGQRTRSYFNPRTPCGVRPSHPRLARACDVFQSTHPLRGATANLTNSYPQICAKATKMDLLSEEKMRYGLPQTACVSHFRSFLGAKLQRFSARLPFALRS